MNWIGFSYDYSALPTPIASMEGVLGVSIPLATIVMPFFFVLGVLAIVFVNKYKTRKLKHETIRLMVEKGQPIPSELLTGDRDPFAKKHDDRKTGLILIAVGIGLYFFFANFSGMDKGLAWVALIPGLIGLALLLNWWLDRKNQKASLSEDKKN
jgi:hypothetical protein